MQTGPERNYPDHYRNAAALPRVNIAGKVKELAIEGYEWQKDDLLKPPRKRINFRRQEFRPSPEKALEIYHAGKAERYALTSVLANKVIDRAIKDRSSYPPYGLLGHPLNQDREEITSQDLRPVEGFCAPDPLSQLNFHMHRTLGHAWTVEMNEIYNNAVSNPEDPISTVYTRLQQWETFYNKFLPKTPRGTVDLGGNIITFNSVFTERATGTLTGAEVIAGLLRAVHETCEREMDPESITPELLSKIARDSYPLVAKMRKMGSEMEVGLEGVLDGTLAQKIRTPEVPSEERIGHYKNNYFRLINSSDGKHTRLDITPEVLTKVEHYMGFVREMGQGVTIGCPAGESITEGEKGGIEKLWDWSCDIFEDMSHDLWNVWFEPKEIKRRKNQFIKEMADRNNRAKIGLDF